MNRFHTWSIEPGSLEYPLVIAHRGGSDLAPENTIAAFRKTMGVGADGVEMDVRLTKDKEVVVLHDRRLDRTTNGRGLVGTNTFQEIKALDAGSWFGPGYKGEKVPALAEVFEALPGNYLVYIELKVRGTGVWSLASRVVKVIRAHHRWDSTMVASFNPIAVAVVRVLEPRIARGYIWSASHPFPIKQRWLSPLVNPRWLAPDRNTYSRKLLDRFHRQGKSVAAWNWDVRALGALSGESKLDAVVTDNPLETFKRVSGLNY